MTCGDTRAQWVPAITGSVYSGTIASDGGDLPIYVVLLPAGQVAVTTIDGIAHTGVWAFLYGNTLGWTAALNGSSYTCYVTATTCDSGRVTVADGSGTDSFQNGRAVHLEKIL